jgi:hypothetical protein
MHRSVRSLTRLTAIVAVLGVLAVAAAQAVSADDWGRGRAALTAQQELDPAIRAAIAARASAAPTAPIVAPTPSTEDGFAWEAAAIGAFVGIGAMCIALACVTLVRHDGRLRSA